MLVYFGALQIFVYSKNEDKSSFMFRKFNLEENDKYPTFSICLFTAGDDEDYLLYNADTINEQLHVDTETYINMITGYSENLSFLSGLDFDDAKWDLLDILNAFSMTSYDETVLDYWDDDFNTSTAPFYTTYQDPSRLCITRKEKFLPKQSIFIERIWFDVYQLKVAWKGTIKVYVHPHGQFIETIQKPQISFEIYGPNTSISYNNIVIKINQVQVLKKRYDAPKACNRDLDSDVDMRWRESVMNSVNCIPTYWKRFPKSSQFMEHNHSDCNKSMQYRAIGDYCLTAPTNVTYEPSCTETTIISNTMEHLVSVNNLHRLQL